MSDDLVAYMVRILSKISKKGINEILFVYRSSIKKAFTHRQCPFSFAKGY